MPVWWRHVFVAIATLLFCSCRGQVLPVDPEMQSAAMMGALIASQVTDDGEADRQQGADAVAVEVGSSAVPASARESARPRPEGGKRGDAGATFETLTPTTIVEDDGATMAVTPQGIAVEPWADGDSGVCSACNGAGGACCGDPCQGRIIGPSDEYLCDGGDFGLPAGVKADWSIEGLEQEDAIAHYDTIDGRVIVTPSSRVCIYAPRFAAVRRVVNLMAHERGQFIEVMLDEQTPTPAKDLQPVASSLQRRGALVNLGQQPATLFRGRQQAGGLENLQAAMDVYESLAAYANLKLVRAGILENAEKPLVETSVEAAVAWTGDQSAQVVLDNRMAVAAVGVRQAALIYQTDGPDNPRLRLVKLASRAHALPGEDVEFTLRYDNIGDQVIGNVTIVDNLATRLEYVPKTAQSTVDANFITAPNTGGSTILRWEIKDPVKPGEGGVLRFRARVR